MQTPDEQSDNVGRGEPEERLAVPSLLSGENPQPLQSEAESSLVELLATLGHEFRTPLAVIAGSTSTLLRRAGQMSREEQQEFLQMIQQAGRRLQVLTERLFELAQLEAGTVDMEGSAVDISAVAREAITSMQAQVPEELCDRVSFHLHCRDEAGNPTQQVPLVRGDRQALRKVLGHLLENALRFSPGGSIDVVVRPAPPEERVNISKQVPTSSAFLEVCVCDLGIGIPTEHLSHIFERFYQVDRSLSREVNGLGIGLTICHHLVTLHQGHLWAESCPAGGSAFHLWLPLSLALHS